MTLKELCFLYKECNQEMIKCSVYRSEYYHRKKDEAFEELDKSDLEDLRIYLLCDILSMYEYLAIKSNTQVADWFRDYNGICCPMEDNDDYKCYKMSPLAPENAESIYIISLGKSIEPFKSRGICAEIFNSAV